MTEHKFTDEEIIKALECCNRNGTCSKCPFDRASFEHEPDCASVMTANALDLINRQKTEVAYWMDAAANAKKEAVKAFAERVKEIKVEIPCRGGLPQRLFTVMPSQWMDKIDLLVKEMTGV